MFGAVYQGRRVFLTGHTGFKGSWLALWLSRLGAQVGGMALPPDTRPSHWDLLRLSLASEARMDIRDDFLKSTALGWACRWGRVDLVKLLLARGADAIEADAEPWARPLAWAERRQHVKVVSLLRQHGA